MQPYTIGTFSANTLVIQLSYKVNCTLTRVSFSGGTFLEAQPGFKVTHTEIPTILQTPDLWGNEEQINYMWELKILTEIVE